MLRIITDFDGPIMDVSERYYQVYKFCLEKIQYPNQELKPLSKAEFWQLKRSCTPETQIALRSGLNETQAAEFSSLRRKTVHTQPYFEYDILVPGAIEALGKITSAGIDLVVMTMRRVRELDYAFKKYNLDKFFPTDRCYCLSNEYVKTRDVEDKPLLMSRALAELPTASHTWMIGDTDADITAAKTHGIEIIAVESGIRDRTQLEHYQPDLIVKDLGCAVDLIMMKSL